MSMHEKPARENWASHFGFILAAAGSAIGLGNLWKFPYMTYKNEGGSFVLVYLVSILLIGLPIMMAEIIIGRRAQKSPVGAFLSLGGKLWSPVGMLGIAVGFIILSYYAVIAGWTIQYIGRCLVWSFSGFNAEDARTLGDSFGAFLRDGTSQVVYHGVFMGLTIGVVAFGVKSGIERVAKILMPVLLLILVALVLNSMRTPGFGEAIGYLFTPGHITKAGILEALGQAFFSLSLGMGAMITYGSYMRRESSIPKSSAMVCILDTAIALMAAIIMLSIIFSQQDRSQFGASSTILFTTLPRMFYELPAGQILSPLFYILVALAALTSTISLLEVVVSFFIDQLGWHRVKSAIGVGLVIFVFGIFSALSFGASKTLSEFSPINRNPENAGFFGQLDYLSTNWLLPIGGLLIAVFVGWFLPDRTKREELSDEKGLVAGYRAWRFVLRFVCPIGICWIIYEVIMGAQFN
jgi:NSS family neurotransmitter:Na+ symporter